MKKNCPLLLIILIVFCGCNQSNRETIKINIENYLKKTMNNPSSFQFVDMKIDTSYVLKERLKNIQREIDEGHNTISDFPWIPQIEIYNNYGGVNPYDKMEDSIFEVISKLKLEKKALILKLTSIKHDKILRYIVNYKIRETNELNATVLKEYSIDIDTTFNVISKQP